MNQSKSSTFRLSNTKNYKRMPKDQMPQQRIVWLLLLLAGLWGTAAAQSVDHSDLAVHVFSSMQAGSSGDSLPPYPEGIELELTCQAAARSTFWYEKRPPNAVPDKLPSRSLHPVPGVLLSVYTIPSLERKDDGRELWCMMDGSSIKKVVNLTVVGPPSLPVIYYTEKGNGLELECSSDHVDHHLELCWYRDDKKLQCKFLGEKEEPPTTVTMHVTGEDLVKEATLVCKARFKDDRVLETLTKKTQEHFTSMLKTASVELKIEGRELASCNDDEPQSESPGTKTFNLRDPDNNLCRKVTINEHKSTTAAPPTTLVATTTTPALKEVREFTLNENGGSAIDVATLPLLLSLALAVLL